MYGIYYYVNCINVLISGVVGNFLLWERYHGIMVTYPIVIRGGGVFGGIIKGKNPCLNMGG